MIILGEYIIEIYEVLCGVVFIGMLVNIDKT